MLCLFILPFPTWAIPYETQGSRASIHHDLNITVSPALKHLSATDRMTLPFPSLTLKIWLNKSLDINQVENGKADKTSRISPQNQEQEWLLTFTKPVKSFSLEYSGIVFDPLVDEQSSGLISADGVTLFGSSYWYPVTDSFVTFNLKAHLPEGWQGLTQGKQINGQWQELLPQEDIAFVAAPFFIFTREVDGHTYRAYLRQNDPQLAQQFLDLTPTYIQEYAKLIDDYPYKDFSVVENFWETGFGLPSMTLLGPNVIRLPFILHSSYPHEILHNWWGNSVYVDYKTGNWSEGLTTYMADHREQEKVGQDALYRLKSLTSYMDYATGGEDFPLRQFTSRHSQSTQAVGYGKSMMFFHMLKVRFGEKTFNKAIQSFYKKNKFRHASFTDIEDAFTSTTGEDLTNFFTQWLDRTGAPRIRLTSAGKWRSEKGYYLSLELRQEADKNYELHIPVHIKMKSGESIIQNVSLNSAATDITLEVPDNPIQVEVDPNFEMMRLLANEEKPSSLSNLFGAKEFSVLREENDKAGSLIAETWKEQLQSSYSESFIRDGRLPMPTSGPVLIIGSSPAVIDYMQNTLAAYDATVDSEKISIRAQAYELKTHTVVIVLKNPKNPEQPIVWISLQNNTNGKDLAGRLLHYGQYSALIFKDRPNIYKATWLSPNSPLKRNLERRDP